MIDNQTIATVNDLHVMTEIIQNASNYSIGITIIASIVVGLSLGLLFHSIANKDRLNRQKEQQKTIQEHRKHVKEFILSRLNRIQNALDLQQQNLDAIDAGKAPSGITKEGLNVAIWRDALQTNYADIRFVFLSNLMEMPLGATIDELDSLLDTNPLKEKIIAINGITELEEILKAIRDLIAKLDP